MADIRVRILALCVWIGLFYNIERLDIDKVDIINLPTYVYLLSFVAIALPLIFKVNRTRIIFIAGTLFLLFSLGVVLDTRTALNGTGIYITFASFCLLLGCLVLAYRVGEATNEFMQAVETVTLSDRDGVLLDLDDAKRQIENEMLRSRRTHRPLSLIVVKASIEELKTAPHRLIQDIQRKMAERYLLAVTARTLSRSLRRTDLLVETGKPGYLVLIAPETSAESATVLGERLEEHIHERLGIATTFAVAAFPERGLTFEALLSSAEEALAIAKMHPAEYPIPATMAEATLIDSNGRQREPIHDHMEQRQ